MKNRQWYIVFLFGFMLGFVLTPVGTLNTSTVSAASSILYVSATDPTCGGQSPCFTTLQAAVNAAVEGDEIRVASGTYSGATLAMVNGNPYTQVVLITKSLTLQGGYTTANWVTANPAANRTVIDARRQGRGVSIVGDGRQTVTVAGFTITGGDYTGLGNPADVGNQVCARTGSDCGGGLFAHRVTLVLRDNLITDNIASRTRFYSDGGGAYLWSLNADSRLENTTFIGNMIQGGGGNGAGAYIDFGQTITLTNTRFQENQSSGEGGGLFIFQPSGQVLIEDTVFVSNISGGDGGALEARLTFPDNALQLNRVTMRSNQARGQGAALSLLKQGSGNTTVGLTNILLAANSLESPGMYGAAINASGGSGGEMNLRLSHLTWATQPALAALRLSADAGQPIRASLINALIDSAAAAYIGNQVAGDVMVQHTNTLTNRVSSLHTTEFGMPVFEAVNSLRGNPRLDANYHLRSGSAAIDAGAVSGVPDDVDGDPRPIGAGYDVGADEYVPAGAK